MIAEIATPALTLAAIGLVAASALVLLGRQLRDRAGADEVTEAINALLPQIQCAQCGYPGCRPYAHAVAEGEAADLCPPGGNDTAIAIAELLGRDSTGIAVISSVRKVARIIESDCIGCALCLDACPVDAIVGAPKFMHSVLARHCTGCELCIPPCPVDCIELVTCD